MFRYFPKVVYKTMFFTFRTHLIHRPFVSNATSCTMQQLLLRYQIPQYQSNRLRGIKLYIKLKWTHKAIPLNNERLMARNRIIVWYNILVKFILHVFHWGTIFFRMKINLKRIICVKLCQSKI